MNIKQMLVSAAVAMLFAPAAMAMETQASALDARGNSIMDERGGCVLTKWESMHGGCGYFAISKEDRTIYFDFNKSTIKASEKAKLDALIHAIKHSKKVTSVDIVGFADRIGRSGYNKRLSHRRAEAVKAYLWHHGVHTHHVILKAMGEADSVTHCSPSLPRKELIACLAPDRRVEIQLNLVK